MRCSVAKFLIPLALFAAIGVAADTHSLGRQVRHELVMLPYYSVFDNFTYQVDGSTVVLAGQVTRPTLKSGAERVVERIEGVREVVNKIEVLPLSSSDDRVRWAVYRAIYHDSALSRYAVQAVPPIHIVVRNGDVTLEGVVNASTERDVANARANAVLGVFSVVNNLRIESRGSSPSPIAPGMLGGVCVDWTAARRYRQGSCAPLSQPSESTAPLVPDRERAAAQGTPCAQGPTRPLHRSARPVTPEPVRALGNLMPRSAATFATIALT